MAKRPCIQHDIRSPFLRFMRIWLQWVVEGSSLDCLERLHLKVAEASERS